MNFTPLSNTEVLVVLHDLEDRVRRTPKSVTDSAFEGLIRLALTAAQRVTPVAPVAAPTTPVEVQPSLDDMLTLSIQALRERGERPRDEFLLGHMRLTIDEVFANPEATRLREVSGERDTLKRQVESANERTREMAREAEASKTMMESAQETLREAERDNTSLREQLALATRNVEEFKKRLAAEQEESARARLEVTTTKDSMRQTVKESVSRILRLLEWSKTSTTINRTTRVYVMSCPSCDGLNPKGLNPARNVGHQKGCALEKLLRETETK